MKNYNKSDYAVNKYSDGIVYSFADGIVTITLADYLAENPDKTEGDFIALKTLSDSIYLKEVQDENAQTYKNVSYEHISETTLCCVQSPEDLFIDEIDAQAETAKREQLLDMANHALDELTEV